MKIVENIKNSVRGVYESLTSQAVHRLGVVSASLRNSLFHNNIFKDDVQSPHEEMRDIELMYRQNTYVVTAVDLFTDAIFGRESKIMVQNEEELSLEKGKVEEWNQRVMKELQRPLREAVHIAVKTGNGYMELIRDAKGELRGFNVISRSHDVYIDSQQGEVQRYIYKVPFRKTSDNLDGLATKDLADAKQYRVSVGQHQNRVVYGVSFKPDELMHIRLGTSHIGMYGRSPLASATNDMEVIKELEKNTAIISRYKAENQKYFSVKNSDGTYVSDTELQQFKTVMQEAGDGENVFYNRELEGQDISHEGKHVDQTEALRYHTRKLVTALAPDFYMFGETSNYAVADEQKTMFFLRVQKTRNMFSFEINDVVREYFNTNIREGINIVYEFGEFDFPTQAKKEESALQQFKAGLITLNEARSEIGLETIEDEVGDMYRFDIEPPSQGQGQKGQDVFKQLLSQDG